MSLLFDPSDASLVLQVVIFFLLVIGLPFVTGIGAKKNFMIHGQLAFLALILHAFLVFITMIPTPGVGFGILNGLSFSYAFIFWSYVILGNTAEILGFALLVLVFQTPLKYGLYKNEENNGASHYHGLYLWLTVPWYTF